MRKTPVHGALPITKWDDVYCSVRENGSRHTPRTQSQVREEEPGTCRGPGDAERGHQTGATRFLDDVGGGISFEG